MSSTDFVNNLANFIVVLAAIPFWAFSITYALKDAFYETYLGVIIWGMVTSNALVLTYVATRRWWGEYFGFEWIAVILYTSMTVFAALFYAIYLVERRRSETLQFPLAPQRKVKSMTVKTEQGVDVVVPDIWYKGKRVLRTGLAVLSSFLVFWAAFAIVAPEILAELAKILPGPWVAWIAGTIAIITTVAGVITRILAIPVVNTWLTNIGLGSVPKEALEAEVYKDPAVANGAVVQVVTTVKPDPKAEVVSPPPAVG